jgi:hypothetical protein
MFEIKQIVDQSFIDRLKKINDILDKMRQLEKELESLDIILEIRINPGDS